MVKVASLFDGIGGTPLCAQMAGASCLWASEIEKFPIEVTKYHFPNMAHYGDITQIKGADVPAVDIIVGGSPCQDLSVAGKRKGLMHEDLGSEEHTRSGLFMEQVRIVKEMREHARATNQPIRPRYVIWENVPGAFSSNAGEDFKTVLEELCKIADETVSIPRPNGKWLNAGAIVGIGFSLAWRISDAQYWGVAQRRRRIFLVADFGGQSAPEILFEREGVSGYIAESFGERKRAAGDAARGFGETGSGVKCYGISSYMSNSMLSYNPHSGVYEASTSRTLDLNGGTPACNQGGIAIVQVYENHGQDSRITGPLDVSPTVSRKYGTGGNNVPLVARMQSFDGEYAVDGTASALKARDYKDATDLVVTYRIRRLTPLECERLQGYPDGWTDIPGASDSARYRALGNSFAIPNAYFVISRCIKEIKEAT